MIKLKFIIKTKLYVALASFIIFSCGTRSLEFNMEKRNDINSNSKNSNAGNTALTCIDGLLDVFDKDHSNDKTNSKKKSICKLDIKMPFKEIKQKYPENSFYYIEDDNDSVILNKTPLGKLQNVPKNAKFIIIENLEKMKCGKFYENYPLNCSKFCNQNRKIKGYWSIISNDKPKKALLVLLCCNLPFDEKIVKFDNKSYYYKRDKKTKDSNTNTISLSRVNKNNKKSKEELYISYPQYPIIFGWHDNDDVIKKLMANFIGHGYMKKESSKYIREIADLIGLYVFNFKSCYYDQKKLMNTLYKNGFIYKYNKKDINSFDFNKYLESYSFVPYDLKTNEQIICTIEAFMHMMNIKNMDKKALSMYNELILAKTTQDFGKIFFIRVSLYRNSTKIINIEQVCINSLYDNFSRNIRCFCKDGSTVTGNFKDLCTSYNIKYLNS